MNAFWIDNDMKLNISYDELYGLIVKSDSNNIYVQDSNPFSVFLNVLRNLVCEKQSILLDADFSEEELNSLELSSNVFNKGKYFQQDLSNRFFSFKSIFEFLQKNSEHLSIEIFTSGTTGRPKKVSQSLKNIIRSVKQEEEYQSNIWAFAYNPTHFAGLQVFFQAFMNMNTMIYVFGKDFKKVQEEIVKGKVTHISSTPTFMKMLLPYVNEKNDNIKNLTFGGERFDESIEKEIRDKFPNTRIRNVYASTEAGSLLGTNGNAFTIPERFSELIKITNDNELIIHKELLGNSDSFKLRNNWYYSGDIVEFIDDNLFLFKNRKSDLINVGGYKVNPEEVENVIRKVQGVKDVLVAGRKNSVMGNIITAQIITDNHIDSKTLKKNVKEYAGENLQEWKVPRVIKFVEFFQLTRTGKIKKQ